MPYYPSGCQTVPPHDPDPCEPTEYARIRSAGFIQAGFDFTTTSSTPDPSDAQEWINGLASGQIIIIPETNGEAPKGQPVIGPRYGPYSGAVLGYDFDATYEDPNYNTNCAFYNSLIGNLNYSFFYRTSSHVYLTGAPVTIIPNRTVKNDLSDDVTWEVQVRWISREFPCGVPTPDSVFDMDPYYYQSSGGGGGNTDPNIVVAQVITGFTGYIGTDLQNGSGTGTLTAGTTTTGINQLAYSGIQIEGSGTGDLTTGTTITGTTTIITSASYTGTNLQDGTGTGSLTTGTTTTTTTGTNTTTPTTTTTTGTTTTTPDTTTTTGTTVITPITTTTTTASTTTTTVDTGTTTTPATTTGTTTTEDAGTDTTTTPPGDS